MFAIRAIFRFRWVAAGLAAAPLLGAALAPAAPVPGPDTLRIDLRNFMFAPSSMTVKAGATVTWTNRDQEPHTLLSSDGLFRSGALDTGDSFSYKFDKPGTYRYVCTIHPRMVGIVVVE